MKPIQDLINESPAVFAKKPFVKTPQDTTVKFAEINSTHVRCLNNTFLSRTVLKVNQWTCSCCFSVELPFHNTRDLFDPTNNEDLDDTIPFEPPSVTKLNQYRQHFSVAHLNTQSISSTFVQFEAMLNAHKFDIITLSETWLKDNVNLLNSVGIPGYNKNFRNRDRVKGGGVGYYVKSDIDVKERKDLTNLDNTIEHQWIEISGQKKSPNTTIGIFYQPNRKVHDKLQFLEKFETILSQVTLLQRGRSLSPETSTSISLVILLRLRDIKTSLTLSVSHSTAHTSHESQSH